MRQLALYENVDAWIMQCRNYIRIPRLGESPKLLRSNNIVQGGHHGGVILRQAGLNRCLVGAPGGDLFGGAVGRRCPDSFWKMAIPRPARNYMQIGRASCRERVCPYG